MVRKTFRSCEISAQVVELVAEPSRKSRFFERTSHNLMVPSSLADATVWPFERNTTLLIQVVWPNNVPSSLREAKSHSRIVASRELVARVRPSGEKVTELTRAL